MDDQSCASSISEFLSKSVLGLWRHVSSCVFCPNPGLTLLCHLLYTQDDSTILRRTLVMPWEAVVGRKVLCQTAWVPTLVLLLVDPWPWGRHLISLSSSFPGASWRQHLHPPPDIVEDHKGLEKCQVTKTGPGTWDSSLLSSFSLLKNQSPFLCGYPIMSFNCMHLNCMHLNCMHLYAAEGNEKQQLHRWNISQDPSNMEASL